MYPLTQLFACLALLCVFVLPFVWIAFEFSSKRWLRLTLGIASIVTGVVLAQDWGHTTGIWETNAWFAKNNTRLIDATIRQLEAGDSKTVLDSLKQLRQKYYPNYDTRSNFDQLVDEAVKNMQPTNATAPATDH